MELKPLTRDIIEFSSVVAEDIISIPAMALDGIKAARGLFEVIETEKPLVMARITYIGSPDE